MTEIGNADVWPGRDRDRLGDRRGPFGALAGSGTMAVSEVGRADWTRLEPFVVGVLALEPRILELIRAA